jgi:putative transcriptional regulator
VPRKNEPGLSNCIRDLRTLPSGMTQQDLADRVGVTRQTIIALEGGAYTPSLTLALRIAKVFGKKVEDVFRLDE